MSGNFTHIVVSTYDGNDNMIGVQLHFDGASAVEIIMDRQSLYRMASGLRLVAEDIARYFDENMIHPQVIETSADMPEFSDELIDDVVKWINKSEEDNK